MEKSPSEILYNILMVVSFSIIVITIVFFVFSTNIEAQIISNNLNYIVNVLGTPLNIMPPDMKSKLINMIDIALQKDCTQNDNDVQEQNSQLIINTIGTIFMIIIFMMLLCILLPVDSQPDVILSSIVLAICSGFVELFILIFIIKQYISVDINGITSNILNLIKKNLINTYCTTNKEDKSMTLESMILPGLNKV
jgi:hypothetical protein